MLVEFAVKNYRSLRDEQRLSMVASASKDHEETNVFDSGSAAAPRLLRSAVVYGANAAGKSNLLTAFECMQDMVTNSAKERQAGEPINVVPFLLDGSAREPTSFEAVFVLDGIKFQYGFAATRERITEEWLFAFPEKRAQRWFYRQYDSSVSDYNWKFSTALRGPKNSWKTATRSNALFLSTAVQLNADQLAPVLAWFRIKLRCVLGTGNLSAGYSKQSLTESDKRLKIAAFLKNADTGIEDLHLLEVAPDQELSEMVRSMPDFRRERVLKDLSQSVNVLHRNSNGEEVWFRLEDESQGTQKLFAYAGPFLDVLSRGRILIVDELNNSLHPLILQMLISTFHDVKANEQNAQLIFASHGTSILNLDLFRRDQIWFAEKKDDHSTVIYPLTDFSPRKESSLSRGYLQGRFGAIPFLSQSLING